MGLIEETLEEAREELANDAKFWRNFVYFFELNVPPEAFAIPSVAKSISLIIPLVLNPQGITITDPFAIATTPTLDGGLFVEENGILSRTLQIRGTTGFKPRRTGYSMGVALVRPKSNRASFAPRGTTGITALSGHKHFQFIQDRVFRTYGDLKRDPSTAEGTSLIFHNIKDDEHWLVAPRSFRMERTAEKGPLYYYSIDLEILDQAAAHASVDLSEDKSLFDTVKDTVRMVKNAVDGIIGVINDLKGLVNEISQFVSGALDTLRKAADFVTSVADFVTGAADSIARPFNVVTNIVKSVDTALAQLDAAGSAFTAGDTVRASFRQLQDAFFTFGLHPEIFQDPTATKLSRITARGELSTAATKSALANAAANPPGSLSTLALQGTAPQPGDQQRALSELGLGRNQPQYRSVDEFQVEQGDTLPNIAARRLGDARLWKHIALLNNLRDPYISTQRLPGTLGPGDKILVPSLAKSPAAQPLAMILGAQPSDSTAKRLLGTDLLLVPSSRNPRLQDFAVDRTKGGPIDFKTVTGIDNLSQGLVTRMTTEQGTDVLYRQLGYKRLVGVNLPFVDSEIANFRMSEAVAADPRIASVVATRTIQAVPATISADTVVVQLDAAVRGIYSSITVAAPLPAQLTGTGG